MSTNMNNDKDNPTDAEACYETVAGQEEIYLEETEEEVRAILVFCDPPPSQNNDLTLGEKCEVRELDWEADSSTTETNDNPRIDENLNDQRNQAAEELITGDSDDPPLSEEEVGEKLRMTSDARSLTPKPI
jgi:hypothetical protein